jgi:hypothetical protein
LFQNGVEIVPGYVAWIEDGSIPRLKEKAAFSIAYEVAQDYRSVWVNVYVSASRFRLQMLLNATHSFLPLLPNANDRAIGFDVLVSQARFLSIVIPDFGMGEPSMETAWVGRLKADGEWEQLTSAGKVLILS